MQLPVKCVLIVSKLGRPVKLSGVCCLLRWWPIHNDHVTGPSGSSKRKTLDRGERSLDVQVCCRF